MVRRIGLLLLLAALLAAAAWYGRKWWSTGAEFRAPLAALAMPGPEHVGIDCGRLPRGRLMVVLVLGQSNSANHAQTRAAGGTGVFSWHEGRCYAALDPLPGASGDGGSLWTHLGPAIVSSGAFDAVLFVPLGITSTSVAQWARHPFLVQRLTFTVQGLWRAGREITHVVWYQGEADSFKQTPASEYRRDFAQVLERLRSIGVAAPIWVAQATLCQARSNPAVRKLQARLPHEFAGVRAGPDMDALFGPLHRYNGCHFSTSSAPLAAQAWLQVLLHSEPAPRVSTP